MREDRTRLVLTLLGLAVLFVLGYALGGWLFGLIG